MRYDNTVLFRVRDETQSTLNEAMYALNQSATEEAAKEMIMSGKARRASPDQARLASLELRMLQLENQSKALHRQSEALAAQCLKLMEAVERITSILERITPEDR